MRPRRSRTIVERLAKRQFMGLWAARNKTTGHDSQFVATTSTLGALNTTTGVVWNLPAAVRRGWVAQADADAYMDQLVASLNTNRNQTTYLPTRFLDLVTAAPPYTDHEESSIDAAFIALALHNYKSQPATPAALRDCDRYTRKSLRFRGVCHGRRVPAGLFSATGQFGCCTYSGYTNENKVIALAAEVIDAHHVPLASSGTRTRAACWRRWSIPSRTIWSIRSAPSIERPFVQALLNLFVDTSERGADNYPNRDLARNPWKNFVRYEAEVAAKLDQLGRDEFLQPDAGAGAGTYQPWNLYNNFGQPNLFQPWSVALMLMAGRHGAEDALRFLLDNGLGNGLDGPQGLADSAQWVDWPARIRPTCRRSPTTGT